MSQGHPRFSIIMPTYRRGYIIRRAIDSVLCQSYQDWELIVVVDGCVDDTLEVLRQYDDPRIRVIVHEHNKGILTAKNTGLNSVRGEWVAFLADDDEIVPHALSRVAEVQKAIDPAVNMIYTHAYDTAKGHVASEGQVPGYLDSRTMVPGDSWPLVKRDTVGDDRFIDGLNTHDGELWVRLLPCLKRYFHDETLRVNHTEGTDRQCLGGNHPDSAWRGQQYREWCILLDARPDFFAALEQSGLEVNRLPVALRFLIENDDVERALTAAMTVPHQLFRDTGPNLRVQFFAALLRNGMWEDPRAVQLRAALDAAGAKQELVATAWSQAITLVAQGDSRQARDYLTLWNQAGGSGARGRVMMCLSDWAPGLAPVLVRGWGWLKRR